MCALTRTRAGACDRRSRKIRNHVKSLHSKNSIEFDQNLFNNFSHLFRFFFCSLESPSRETEGRKEWKKRIKGMNKKRESIIFIIPRVTDLNFFSKRISLGDLSGENRGSNFIFSHFQCFKESMRRCVDHTHKFHE